MSQTKPSPPKRMGPEDSATREMMFDAAEQLLQQTGYQALTARRVAKLAGFNHQTVYYYFSSMDDLVIGAFRRRASGSLTRLSACLESTRPLHLLVELVADQGNARLSLEYAAIAMRVEGLAIEVRDFLDRSRDIEEAVIAKVFAKAGIASDMISPDIVAMLMLAVSQFLAREAALGFDRGHHAMEQFLERYLRTFEQDEELSLRKHLSS